VRCNVAREQRRWMGRFSALHSSVQRVSFLRFPKSPSTWLRKTSELYHFKLVVDDYPEWTALTKLARRRHVIRPLQPRLGIASIRLEQRPGIPVSGRFLSEWLWATNTILLAYLTLRKSRGNCLRYRLNRKNHRSPHLFQSTIPRNTSPRHPSVRELLGATFFCGLPPWAKATCCIWQC
jgi:hypothetical protein